MSGLEIIMEHQLMGRRRRMAIRRSHRAFTVVQWCWRLQALLVIAIVGAAIAWWWVGPLPAAIGGVSLAGTKIILAFSSVIARRQAKLAKRIESDMTQGDS